MTLTTQTEQAQITAVVAVRVPRHADGGLAAEAEQRLSRTEGVERATVERLRGIEPGLSATVVTVDATLETTTTPGTLRETFDRTVGIEAVEAMTGA